MCILCVFVCVFVFVFVFVSACAFDVIKLIKNFFFICLLPWSKFETDLPVNREINLVWP